MMLPTDPIREYHALLGESALAADSQAALSAGLERHGLRYGDRMMQTALRPRFLTEARFRFLRARTQLVMEAVRRVHSQAMAEPALRRRLGVRDWEEPLLGTSDTHQHPHPVVRFDGFFAADGRLRFVELNAQSPAGGGYSDGLSAVFNSLPVMQAFRRTVGVTDLPCRPTIRSMVLDAFRRWSTDGAEPRLAIVDWNEVPTHADFELIRDEFQAAGVLARVTDPHELEYDGERLTVAGVHVNLVYRRVLADELLNRCGPDHALFRAARDQAVCVVNPFPCRLAGKKALFAVLSDPASADLFTPAQRAALRDHIPWTRIVTDTATTFGGQTVSLLPFVTANRERLVLKPNDNYGGRRVTLGHRVTDAEWAVAVEMAVREGHVVQEHVELPAEAYPVWENGSVQFADRYVDTCPFVGSDNRVFGSISRLSAHPVVNMATGNGSLVPTFLVG